MSRFYMTARTPEKKTVAKKGARHMLATHVRGWNKGVIVEATHVNDLDTFYIYETDGSNGEKRKLIKTLVDKKSAGPRNPKGQLK